MRELSGDIYATIVKMMRGGVDVKLDERGRTAENNCANIGQSSRKTIERLTSCYRRNPRKILIPKHTGDHNSTLTFISSPQTISHL